MTAPGAILDANPKRTTESPRGWALRILTFAMRIAHNEGVKEAEAIILERQKKTTDRKLENELSNILIDLHETKIGPQ